ncbi:MAG: phosphatidylglycerol lysyltransferase domain-containing protein [Boseongicola sp.]
MLSQFNMAIAATPRSALHNFAMPLTILASCILAAWYQLEKIDAASVTLAIASISPSAWLISLAATIASFLTVARYDAMFHGWLATGVSVSRSQWTGASSIALSQFLGFGLFTGTLCRWRMLPEISLPKAAMVTAYVSAAFMLSLGLLVLIAMYLSDLIQSGEIPIGILAAVIVIGLCILSLRQPNWLPFSIPPIPLLLRVVTTTAIDVGFAGLAFWILLPDLGVSFSIVLSVFLLALGAGLMSGTPFGLGPFEVCILTLLPQVPTEDLLAAILGFRLVFFAIPACLAIFALACPPAKPKQIADQTRCHISGLNAEAGFSAVSATHDITSLANTTCLTARASQSLVVIGDPVCGQPFNLGILNDLCQIAGTAGRWPIIYKCTRQAAAVARRAGWSTVAISEEAWIRPQDFHLEIPARRQLRRKLRLANRAGITVELANQVPLDAMARVAQAWSTRNGGERGFSMGRYSHHYVAKQAVFLAFQDNDLVAFASFHTAEDNWTLDLLRSQDGTPDGTMHALVAAAIQQAKIVGIARLSLSAMPMEDRWWPYTIFLWCSCGSGLRQFKLSFAPRVRTLYAAAKTPIALILGGFDISLRILYPDPATDTQYACGERSTMDAEAASNDDRPTEQVAGLSGA